MFTVSIVKMQVELQGTSVRQVTGADVFPFCQPSQGRSKRHWKLLVFALVQFGSLRRKTGLGSIAILGYRDSIS